MRGACLLLGLGLGVGLFTLAQPVCAEALPIAPVKTVLHFAHVLDVAGHRVEWRMQTAENQHVYETLYDDVIMDQIRITTASDPEFAPYIWRTSQKLESAQADLHEFGIMLGRYDVDQTPLPYLLKAPLAEAPLSGSHLSALGSQSEGK